MQPAAPEGSPLEPGRRRPRSRARIQSDTRYRQDATSAATAMDTDESEGRLDASAWSDPIRVQTGNTAQSGGTTGRVGAGVPRRVFGLATSQNCHLYPSLPWA